MKKDIINLRRFMAKGVHSVRDAIGTEIIALNTLTGNV